MDIISQYKRELMVRKYAASTVRTYVECLRSVISKIGEHPTVDQIKQLLLETKGSSYHKQLAGTIKRYFEYVVKQPLDIAAIS